MAIGFCSPVMPPNAIDECVTSQVFHGLYNAAVADSCAYRDSVQARKGFSVAIHTIPDKTVDHKISASNLSLQDLVFDFEPTARQNTDRVFVFQLAAMVAACFLFNQPALQELLDCLDGCFAVHVAAESNLLIAKDRRMERVHAAIDVCVHM